MRNLRNSVQLIGYLGKDPEFRLTQKGERTALLSLATNDRSSETQTNRLKTTNWHTLVATGVNAEVVSKFLVKGSFVAVEGKLLNRSFEDENGNIRYITEIQINELQMISKKETVINRAA